MAKPPALPGPARRPGPLWASGRFALRVIGVDGPRWPRIEIRRPYALIGRAPGADVRIDDPVLSSRQVYLHLDRRGLFAADLASRNGSRIGPDGLASSWLKPGDRIEVAGRQVELIDLKIDDPDPAGVPPGVDPLSDSGSRPLVLMTLYPSRKPEAPLALNSELVFVGRSAACGVSVEEPQSARVQCVIVRTETAAYAVNLLGRDTTLNDRPLRYAEPLQSGDVLAIGDSRFECRILPSGSSPTASVPARRSKALQKPSMTVDGADLPIPEPPAELFQGADGNQALAWMMGVLQASQGEMMRRQDAFQREVVQALRNIQDDNREALDLHMESVQKLNEGLSALRDEVRRRFGPTAAPPRPEPPKVPPLRLKPSDPAAEPGRDAATAWLINRVNAIEQETQSSWKDLLARLGRGGK